MLITCPSCGIRYDVSQVFLAPERKLKCSSCGEYWHAPDTPAPVLDPAVVGAAEPQSLEDTPELEHYTDIVTQLRLDRHAEESEDGERTVPILHPVTTAEVSPQLVTPAAQEAAIEAFDAELAAGFQLDDSASYVAPPEPVIESAEEEFDHSADIGTPPTKAPVAVMAESLRADPRIMPARKLAFFERPIFWHAAWASSIVLTSTVILATQHWWGIATHVLPGLQRL